MCRKILILLSFLTTVVIASYSQEKTTYQEDTAIVNRLLAESKPILLSDSARAVALNGQAKQLAEKIGYKQGAAYALKNMGIAAYYKSNYVGALEYYNQSLDVFKAAKDNAGIANLLSNIGVIYFDRGDDSKALDHYLQSLRYAELAGDKLRMLSVLNNIGAVYNNNEKTHDKALAYYLKGLPVAEEIGQKTEEGSLAVNIGSICFNKKDYEKALFYYNKALKAYGNTEGALNAYNAIGRLYLKQKKYDLALRNNNKALAIAEKLNSKLSKMQTLVGLGNIYKEIGDFKLALNYYAQAEQLGLEIEANNELRDLYKDMAITFAQVSDYASAFQYQTLYSDKSRAIYNEDQDKKISALQFGYDLEKKQSEINLLTKDKSIQDLQLKKQRTFRNALMIGLGLVLIIVLVLLRDYRLKIRTNRMLDKQKVQIENLLRNILPDEVAQELQATGRATPRNYESVSILFTDFKSFTSLAENMTPEEVVKELNACFIAFDEIVEECSLEKIKTIGDSYMCAGGIPTPDSNHVLNIVKASLRMQDFIIKNNHRREAEGLPPWEIRIGINVGPVVAGVVGKKKYAYDIWGSAVNIASRMESNGVPGQVNVSAAVYEIIKNEYNCIYRGKIYAKNVGEIDMYFIDQSVNGKMLENFEEVEKRIVQSSALLPDTFG